MTPHEGGTGDGPTVEWLSRSTLRVDGIEFRSAIRLREVDECFTILKFGPMLRRWVHLIQTLRPETVVELGIHEGGSAALAWLLARPELLVAVDLEPTVPEGLSRFIDRRGISDRLRVHTGVDQADAHALGRLVDTDLDGRALDLVIDDASHEYAPTLASFEALFPRIRPGGLFLLEDWAWERQLSEHLTALPELVAGDAAHVEQVRQMTEGRYARIQPGAPDRRPPLLRLALELLLAQAAAPDVLGDLVVTPWWLSIRRGPGSGDGFRLADLAQDELDLLADVGPRER